MALVLKDRVQETTTTTGTGTLTLGGAVLGYQSFSAIGNGNTTYYAIYATGTPDWEVGIGTYTASGTTLSRDTVLASSNSGALVNFSAGTKNVWSDYPAGKAVYLDNSGSISEPIVDISGISGSISTVDTVGFDTTYSTTLTAGQLGWDGNNTLGIGMAGGNVIQHIGEDSFIYTKASSAITKGQVVMFTGAVGASGVPTGAPATGIADGTYIMGIAAESIATNGFGLVQCFGVLRNVNTSGYADGEILWYNPAVTGGLTDVKPSAPNVKVQMAAVLNGGSSGGGSILIRVNAGSTLGGTDSNAQISTPTNGQIITYNNTGGYWKNTSLTAGSGISVTPASDGTLTIANTSPSSGGTVTSVAATAGTGISITGSPITTSGTLNITNTAPDQTVAIASGTGISVTGTYPNFTVTNTAPSSGGTVTSVTGTTPIASSGGTTPDISISQAGTSTDGYLSSTDWNTFNNKQPAGTYVTSVGATSPVTSTGGTTPTIAMPAATGSVDGYLTSTDWTTFNSKGSGTVTSVAASVPSFLSISGSPVTTTGTLAISYSGTALPVANGGTGATSASITSFNNITGYTASGATGTTSTNLVFSTSPSLTTPTLTTPTVTNYTETLYTATGSTSISLANGTVQKITTSGSTTITLPASSTGKSFTVIVAYAAADTIVWAGGSTIKWASGTTPTPTSATGKFDIFNFYQDGTNTYGSIFGQNF